MREREEIGGEIKFGLSSQFVTGIFSTLEEEAEAMGTAGPEEVEPLSEWSGKKALEVETGGMLSPT